MNNGSGMFRDVGEFHARFGLNHSLPTYCDGPHEGDVCHHCVTSSPPAKLADDVFIFRYGFMVEELHELLVAHQRGDLAAFADGLADLVYVALGTAHLARVPMNDVWDEVQRANMAKERATSAADGRSRRGHELDVVKPAGWTPPDVAGVLRRAGWVQPGGPDGDKT